MAAHAAPTTPLQRTQHFGTGTARFTIWPVKSWPMKIWPMKIWQKKSAGPSGPAE
jgi:hypothetical protein